MWETGYTMEYCYVKNLAHDPTRIKVEIDVNIFYVLQINGIPDEM